METDNWKIELKTKMCKGIMTEQAVDKYTAWIEENVVKPRDEKINELTMADMTHEYNEAEAERCWPQFKEQIEEPFQKKIVTLQSEVDRLKEENEKLWNTLKIIKKQYPQELDDLLQDLEQLTEQLKTP